MTTPAPEERRRLNDLPPRQRTLLAAAFIAGGSVFVAGGLRWIDIAPAPGVPHWTIGVVGAFFVLAGVAVGLFPRKRDGRRPPAG
jgi:hypothetical protein